MKYRSVLIAACVSAPLTPAIAASFDCAKAQTRVEHSICDDQNLSHLDDLLNLTYQAHKSISKSNKAQLKSGQRNWLKQTRQECEASESITYCLRDAYTERLAQLGPAADIDPKLNNWKQAIRISDASPVYDFLLDIAGCSERTCESSAYVGITDKNNQRILQALFLPNVFMSRTESGAPLVNSANLYDYQGVINTDDFNFDGHLDFAVQEGNNGSYGGPSYNVFLFNPAHKRFSHAPEFDRLTFENLGFFGVDQKRKRLITYAKSGCCYHEINEHQVVDNSIVEVKRDIQELRAGEDEEEILYLTTEELIYGEWKTTSSKSVPYEEINSGP